MWENAKPFPIELGSLNASADPSVSYPDAIAATNVRFGRFGGVMKRLGHTTYNSTAMSNLNAITGIFQFNRRDTTTRFTIAADKDRIWLVPTSGAWTALAASMGATITDYWDATVFNNELILVNGVTAAQVTDGTAGGTAALVNQASVQTRTAMNSAQSMTYGLHNVEEGTMIAAGGASAGGSYDGITQSYDTIGDSWVTKTRSTVNRDAGVGFLVDQRVYLTSGLITGPALTATCEAYDFITDTWIGVANVTAARWFGAGASANNGGFSITGNDNAGANAWTTANYFYDPVTNQWSTKTIFGPDAARRGAFGFVISQNPHVGGGRITAADAYDAEHSEYNPFTDAWTDLTDITAARYLSGASSAKDNLGYVIGGYDSGTTETNTIYSYNRVTNAWSTSAATMTTAKVIEGVGPDDWYLYMAGGAVGSTAQSSVDRYNVSPAAPVAFYVDSFKSQVIMARTTSRPSRLFYSTVGNSRVWDPTFYIDVNPDDGDWITGIFVFDGRLYVTKTNMIYQISGDAPFDPIEAIPSPIPLENVKGCVSNRSIVVTDRGVFYLAEDGFRLFDGARSILIGEKVQTLLDGYAQSRLKYAAGLWVRSRDEIWWSVTSTGTTHDTLLVFNMRQGKWSVFTGMACEAIATVEDSNGVDQILFGTGDASNGKIYKAETGANDNGSTITSTYQTGWFSPASGLNVALPKDLFMWWKRVSTTAPTVSLRANYSSSDTAEGGTTFSDAVTLTAAASDYFEDAADQRCRVQMAAAATSHALSLRITETSSNTAWELYMAVLQTVANPGADGGFPT